MTTFTGPDLTGASAIFETLMDDECRITDDRGTTDAVLDEATLAMVDVPPPTLYEGRCLVSGQKLQPSDVDLGDAQITESVQEIKVPLGADDTYTPGNRVTILSSRRDPQLIGVDFEVVHVPVHTFAIARKLLCRRLVPDGPRLADPPVEDP